MFVSLFRQEVQAFGFLEALQAALGDLARTMLPSCVRTAVRQVRGQHRLTPQESTLRLSQALASLHATRKRIARWPTKSEDPGSLDKKRMLEHDLYPARIFAAEQTEVLGALSGLEIRHPLNSAAMLDFAMACPVRLRRRNVIDRYMHRKAMAGLLPPVVLERTSKAYFDFIFTRTMQPLCHEQLPPKVVHEWLNLDGEDLCLLWQGARSADGLRWKDWSAWCLFACSTLENVVEEPPLAQTMSSVTTEQRYAGEAT